MERNPSEAIDRVGPLMYLPDLISELGHDTETIFAHYGFKSWQFKDPDNEIPYLAGSHLFEQCAKITGRDDLGLLLGMRADPACLGISGFMLQTAPDVETALLALIRHFDLHDEGGSPSLTVKGSFSYLGFSIHIPEAHGADQIYDLSIAVACKILRGFCGDDWNPTEVLLSRPTPEVLSQYKSYFKAPIRFDAEQNAVVFPTQLLKNKLPGYAPLLHDYLESQASELHEKKDAGLIGRLHRFMRSALITQKCTAGTAAQHFGVNKRMLNRQLRNEGTTFRQELNRTRYAMAQSYLANSNARQVEIALALGYADVTAFNRSFKRWSGMTPEGWRSQNKN